MTGTGKGRATPTEREANDLLDRIGEALRATGVTLEELIESGREIRGELIAEEYGIIEGYQSVPALTASKTEDETTAIVVDNRAERHRTQAQAQAGETLNASRTENAAHDPDEVFADVTDAVVALRRDAEPV